MGSHEGEPPTRERMPGVTRPLSHTLRTRVAEGSHVLRPCAEALRGAHVPRRHLGPALYTPAVRLPRSAVLFKAMSSTLFRPFLNFHFFPSSFFITRGAACTGGAWTASLPANHHLAASLLAEPPRAVANGL